MAKIISKPNQTENFDGLSFFESFCGAPIKKCGKETLFICPKSIDKDRELSVTKDGKWHCKHENCAEIFKCKTRGGGPKQFLTLLKPSLKEAEIKKEIGKALERKRDLPDLHLSESSEKSTYKSLKLLRKILKAYNPFFDTVGRLKKVRLITYNYPSGKKAFAVLRVEGSKGKTFRLVRKVPGGWQYGDISGLRPLYRSNRVPQDISIPIIVVEGEKCANSLRRFLNKHYCNPAFVTTSACGAQSPAKSDWRLLSGRNVIIIPDNDQAGKNYAEKVARLVLEAGAKQVRISLPFGEIDTGYDIADEIPRNNNPQSIIDHIFNAKVVENEATYLERAECCGQDSVLSLANSSCRRFLQSKPRRRKYIISGILPNLTVGVLSAPGGSGKSYLALQMALSIATGKSFLGKFEIESPGGVLYLNAEDDEQELHLRFESIKNELLRGCSDDERRKIEEELPNRLFIPAISGNRRLTLFPDSHKQNKQDLIELARQIPNLRLIILDPANRIMAGDFNRVEEVTDFMMILEEIASEIGATILLVTHSNKASQKGSRSAKNDVNSVLGSQSFVNSARWLATLSVFDDYMVKKFDLSGEPDLYLSLKIPKANYLAPGLGDIYLERIVDNGDQEKSCSGAFKLLSLKKNQKITPEDVEEWALQNPDAPSTTAINALRKKFEVTRNDVKEALGLAVKNGLVNQITGKKNKKVIRSNRTINE